jgi:phenylacetate-CoA ligase
MSEQSVNAYIQKLTEFKPAFVAGYPSNLSLIAQFAREKGVQISPHGTIRGVLTSSETLFSHQRDEIAKAFGAPVFDLYGNTEQSGLLGQCELGGYHDFMEHSVVEILNPDQTGLGELVATSLINYAMPLLRYRTGDMVQLSGERCACGRGLRLVGGLEGRKQDVALMKDGTPLSLTGFFFAVHVPEMSQIRKIQFQQDIPGQLRALVVRSGDYTQDACENMLRRMNHNLPRPFDIDICYVDDIPSTSSGKHRFFVSNVHRGN